MSTLENNTSVVTEEKNILKEVVEKNTKIESDVDKDEPETKKQRLSDLNDDTKGINTILISICGSFRAWENTTRHFLILRFICRWRRN